MDSNFPRTARLPLPLALAASFALASPVPGAPGSGTALAARTLMLATAASPVATAAVFNCADSGAGSLRDAIGSAADGATIDMSQLQCSTITLASGSLSVTQNNLTVLGPGRASLQIKPDAGKKFPVFAHAGSGLLTIGSVRVGYGLNYDPNIGGGCITSPNGSVRVVDAEVSHCFSYQTAYGAVRGGGAIYAKSNVTIDDSLITQNIATASASIPHVAGGGAFAAGNIFVHRSVIDTNQASSGSVATGAAGWGGGLSAKRSIEIVASTISRNYAGVGQGASSNYKGYGGGVFALNYYGGSTLTVTNSTVSNNFSGLYVGGINSSAQTHVSNSTIAFNAARHGYSQTSKSNVGIGLLVYSQAVTLDSTIIAKNSNISGQQESYDFSLSNATVTGSNNLITISGVSPPDTLTSDPKLVALADNGGPTRTHALGALSPAIGAGSNPLNLPSDQRGPGFSRVFARFVDIGAFQSGDAIFTNGLDPPS